MVHGHSSLTNKTDHLYFLIIRLILCVSELFIVYRLSDSLFFSLFFIMCCSFADETAPLISLLSSLFRLKTLLVHVC